MKNLAAKVGSYEKDGKEKGEYVRLGVIGSGEHGEYILLDPTVSLAGVLSKQNLYNHSQGKKPKTSILVSIFDDSNSQSQGQPIAQTLNDDDVPF